MRVLRACVLHSTRHAEARGSLPHNALHYGAEWQLLVDADKLVVSHVKVLVPGCSSSKGRHTHAHRSSQLLLRSSHSAKRAGSTSTIVLRQVGMGAGRGCCPPWAVPLNLAACSSRNSRTQPSGGTALINPEAKWLTASPESQARP